MTAPAKQLLDGFEALSDADKKEVAIEILRRVTPALSGDLPDVALIGIADELFQTLDAEEAAHAPR